MKELKLVPISLMDIEWLDKTEYKNLSTEKRKELVRASDLCQMNGEFFRFYLIKNENDTVGIINMCGHGDKIISIAPEIIEEYRGKGLGQKSLELAYLVAKKLGYKEVVAGIREENVISQKLHVILGFKYVKNDISKNGNELKVYSKKL